MQDAAERVYTLERMFNTLAGFTKDDDWLPTRFYNEPLDMGDHSLICDQKAFNQMHQEYYEAMGWDDKGVPKEETLEDLELISMLKEKTLQLKE